MKILFECKLRRKGGTDVQIANEHGQMTNISFRPRNSDPEGPHYATVEDSAIATRLCQIPEAYRMVGQVEDTPAGNAPTPTPAAPTPTPPAPSPPAPTQEPPAGITNDPVTLNALDGSAPANDPPPPPPPAPDNGANTVALEDMDDATLRKTYEEIIGRAPHHQSKAATMIARIRSEQKPDVKPNAD